MSQEAFGLLRGLEVLASMSDAALGSVAASMDTRRLEAGGVLVTMGEPADALYVIAEGEMDVVIGDVTVARLGVGRGIGEMQMVSGGTRTATVVSVGASRVYRLPRTAFTAFAERSPEALRAIIDLVRQRAREGQIAALLPRALGGASPEALERLRAGVTWVELRRGEKLFAQGDAGDAFYVVASGRLELVVTDEHGVERVVGEAGRGDGVGELALLTGEPCAATPWAVRDTALLRIGQADFERCVGQSPAIMLSLIRTLGRRLRDRSKRAAPRGFGQRFAVVGARPGVPVSIVATRLAGAFATLGSVLHVNPARLTTFGVMDNAATIDDRHPGWLRFTTWLDEQDAAYDYILLECQDSPVAPTAHEPAWNERCVRQADHVLLVASATDDPEPTTGEIALDQATKPRGARRTLVLLHADGSKRPVGTARWLAHRDVDGHVHVRMEGAGDRDFGRLARLLAGKAVGLALGGGGARGFAHIGVIRALEEAGMPVDLVGGTSMGAIIAGMHAMGLSPDEMIGLNEQIIALAPFREFTLPIIAMLRTRRIERGARLAFGDIAIEDLWIPFFCVSASLTTARMVVHERGPVWEATRASGALPGIAVPMLTTAGLLVDGGVVNNLPGDLMRARCRGKVIVVNVSPDEDRTFAITTVPSPWAVLWSWLNPWRVGMDVPTVLHILTRTATLASADRARAVEDDADLYLRPPVQDFGLLDFGRIRDIVAASYHYTRTIVQNRLFRL